MENEELHVLMEISKKLDCLITLLRLSNRDMLQFARKEIEEDKAFTEILAHATGELNASEIKEIVEKKTDLTSRTIERRIRELIDMGFLISRKKGREVYYEASALYG